MPTEDVAYQQRLKIQRTTLGFGVIQVVLGLALTGLSFTAFVLSESEKIRNACPYWAGFTVFCSGGVGIVAWRHTTVLSMGLFTFFSAVCVVLHMIGTILTGEIGGLLKSIIMCQDNVVVHSCICCDSIMTCKQNVPTFEFKGVDDCAIITGLMKELMYGLCVLNIFGSLVCFIATILGCTSVARQAGRDQPFFRRRLSNRSDSHEQSQYSWLHYPAETNVLPPYAPPIYRSVDNVQDCGATPYIVPPPVFDPTDLPPPYSSRNASLSSSGLSLAVQDSSNQRRRPNDGDDNAGGSSAVVLTENDTIVHHYENHYQQRVYSENRARPGNIPQITSVVLTRGVITERSGSGLRIEPSIQNVNSSQVSIHSEKAEECRESNESINNLDNNNKSKQTSFDTVERANEFIKFEENTHKRKSNKEAKRNATKTNNRKTRKTTDDDFSSTSDSGIGDELSASINTNETCSLNSQEIEAALDKDTNVTVTDSDKEKQDSDLEHVTLSSRDAVSPDSQPVDDIAGSNDTIVNSLDSWSESLLGACQLGNLGIIENHGKDSPIVSSMPNPGLHDELVCASNVHEILGQNVDCNSDNIMKESLVQTVEDASGNFAENRRHEQHVTEEVIRLMDDFEANININKACDVSYALEPGKSLAYLEEPDGEFGRIKDAEAESPKRVRQMKEVIPPHGAKAELHNCSRKELFKKNESTLARSDTCIAVLPKAPRESRTGSDPGVSRVGSFVYPGLNQFPFQLVPPNVELPLEIREESIFSNSNSNESKRRKRHGERETSRSKRRALASKDMKAKSQHRTARKDELTSIRERHTKSQNSRQRVDITRSQKYKGKSPSQRVREDSVRNPVRLPSRRKGKTEHGQSASSLQSTGDVNPSNQCGGCTGKETMV